MKQREKIIDQCIEVVKGLVRPHCSDHTPYRGPCCTCGSYDNYEELPDIDNVVETLLKLKNVVPSEQCKTQVNKLRSRK